MFAGLIYTELMKYKRTIIPWMIGIGGILAAGTTFLSISTENSPVNWESFAARGFNFMNLIALLLIAVFAGFVFVTEYHESTVCILFTYPVSRFKLYIVKHFVILFFIISLYMIFFFSTMVFGFINMGGVPSAEFLLKVIKLIVLMAALNFVLVPVTILVSIVIKGIGTYLLVGMSYFLTYISFINSPHSLFIPVCIPDKLAANYFISEYLSSSDFKGILIVSAVTFLSAFFIGAICYSKSDVYN